MDTVNQQTRSRIMACVKSKNTCPELKFRKGLFALGFRYRIHGELPGKPDLVFPKFKAVIFVNGCYWHGHHGCPRFRLPTSNVDYWRKKIERNKFNDTRNIERLTDLGWRVLIAWECEINTNLEKTLIEAVAWLKSTD